MRILVTYDSLTGNVEKMALAVAEGVKEYGGVVDVYSVDEVDLEKVSGYDGFAFGCPTHCGTMSVKMNEFINTRLHKRYWGKLYGKVGVAFTSSGGLRGGNEVSILVLLDRPLGL